LDFVREHNAAESTWEAGINQFSDWTEEEFAAYLPVVADEEPLDGEYIRSDKNLLPLTDDSVDWREKDGVVTVVKNQGSCGSCWAFSAAAQLESWQGLSQGGALYDVSTQQLMDCSGSEGNLGCNGGLASYALAWAIKSNGSCTWTDYPYTARLGKCQTGCSIYVHPKNLTKAVTEVTLGNQVAFQPVSVSVAVGGGFQAYKSGVFSGVCGTQLNHAVLVVGFTPEAWIIKNSWGQGWGEQGYIRIARGTNLCLIGNRLVWLNLS